MESKRTKLMTFREWLYSELVEDEVINEEEYTECPETKEELLTTTELTDEALEDYENGYTQFCASEDIEPDWDLD